MDRGSVSIGQQIAAMLKVYEGNDQFEARDEFFDFLVSAYGDELSDAYSRRGLLLVETAKCTPQQLDTAAIVQRHLEARELSGCTISRNNATSHGGPAILVKTSGDCLILGVHMFPDDIQVIEHKTRGHTTSFSYREVEAAIDLATERSIILMEREVSKTDMTNLVLDTTA